MREVAHIHIHELYHAKHAQSGFQWNANNGLRLQLCNIVDALGEALIRAHVRHHKLFAIFRHVSGDPLAHLQADVLQRLRSLPHRYGEIKLHLRFVHH